MFGFVATAAVAAAGAGWWLHRTDAPTAPPGRPPAQVVLAPAETTRLVRELRAIGTVEATSSVMIAAEVTGRVADLPFEDGQMVEEGRPLVVLDPGPVEAELRVAEAQAAEIAQQVERSGQLAARGFSPRGDLEDARRQLDAARAQAAAARARLDQSRILAPFPGRVGLREVSVGALVQPGTPLVPLDAVDPVDLRFALPEQEAARLAPGAAVRATSAALPGRRFEGEVRVLATRVDAATRTVAVEARLPNPDGVLKPGMLLQVAAAAEVVEAAVTVPPRAVQLRGPDHFVFAIEEGRARRLPVTIGERTAERIEIREGLEPGTQVVVEGLQGLEDGLPVAPAEPQRQAEAAR